MSDTYEFKIGTTQGTLTLLSELTVPVHWPLQTFQSYSVEKGLGSGLSKGLGWSICTWNFGFLSKNQRDQLKQFCPNLSVSLYIRTLDDDLDWHDYSCKMKWPFDAEERTCGRSLKVTLVFYALDELEDL